MAGVEGSVSWFGRAPPTPPSFLGEHPRRDKVWRVAAAAGCRILALLPPGWLAGWLTNWLTDWLTD